MTRPSSDSSWGFGGNSDRPSRRLRTALLTLVATLAGCAGAKGPVFEPLATPLRWPPPPAPARIEYVGQLRTDRDLGQGRSLGEVIFGEEADQAMLSPYGVCTDGGERVFVSDGNAQVVHVFDLAARRYDRWPAGVDDNAEGVPALAQPLGIAWDPRGRLLVADGVAAHVVVLDGAGGGELGVIGEGVLARPSGVAVDPGSGRIFVADAAAHEVVVFDGDGRVRQRLGGRGVEPGQFNFPTNVALDAGGRLYVADSLNFRVQVFDAELRPLRRIGAQGDRPGSFSQPKGLAIDGDGHLYVVDAHFESVQIFDAEGRLLLTFGREGRGPGEFWLPAGIHIDGDDRIWIADTYNQRVQVFRYLREGDEQVASGKGARQEAAIE
jgi:DNA-binding beta-propeller fold protein YncE